METISWLTPKFRLEVRKIYEPRYNRILTETEVEEIALNLTSLLEILLKHKNSRKKH